MIVAKEFYSELQAHPEPPRKGYIIIYSFEGSLWLMRSNGLKYDLLNEWSVPKYAGIFKGTCDTGTIPEPPTVDEWWVATEVGVYVNFGSVEVGTLQETTNYIKWSESNQAWSVESVKVLMSGVQLPKIVDGLWDLFINGNYEVGVQPYKGAKIGCFDNDTGKPTDYSTRLNFSGKFYSSNHAKDSIVFFVSQTGTNAPTASYLQNTLGAPTWARTSAGTFTLTIVGGFPAGKTIPIDDIMEDQNGNVTKINRTSDNVMTFVTYLAANLTVPADGVLNNRAVQIDRYL